MGRRRGRGSWGRKKVNEKREMKERKNKRVKKQDERKL